MLKSSERWDVSKHIGAIVKALHWPNLGHIELEKT